MKKICRSYLAGIAVVLLQGMGILRAQVGNEDWMSGLADDTFVSQLSIPGTHDAGTGHGVNNYLIISGKTYAVTQEKTLTEQWNSGIRAFDLRPAVDGSRLRIYHGVISTDLYFDDALKTLCGLLDSHPTEMCIVIMRHESDIDNNDSSWGEKMKSVLSAEPVKSHAANFNPDAKLGDMRGKILILSRDNYGTNPIGGYITGWGFNPNFANQQGGKISGVGTQGPLYVQDYYDVSGSGAPATKSASIQRMLQFSCTENTNPSLWVVNQTSGYSKTANIFGNTVATSDGYRDNAATQNPVVIDYLSTHTGPTGIILMDFAAEDESNGYKVRGQELTNALIANNFKASPHAEYFRALGAIVPGGKYVVSTTVDGTKYYLTARGKLTSEASGASIFTFSRVEGKVYAYGFNLQNAYFTNPSQSNGTVIYNAGRIRTDTGNKRKDWEAQVFFLNTEGKYAVRATNAVGTGNWEEAAKAYWTVNPSDEGPVAEYSPDPKYVWEVEKNIAVTYNLYFGGEKCGEAVVPSELNTAAALPETYIRDFCTYTYSPRNITSTSIKVTVNWSASAPFKISTDADIWYNLRVGGLGRYVGWEDREPYRPHAYDVASEGDYPEEEYYATELVRASDAYQWSFRGNPIEGFRIFNRIMDGGLSLTVDGTATSVQGTPDVGNTVLRDGDFRWTAHACGDGFSLSLNGREDCYINTNGGPNGFLQVWETPEARTDLGSRLIADEVPAAELSMTPIGDGYFATLCLPYEVTVENTKIYLLGKDAKPDSDGYLLLRNFGGLGVITVYAGVPIVLWGESETTPLTYGNDFDTKPFTETALHGLFLPERTDGALTLKGRDGSPGFYPYEGETLAPNQAVLRLEDGSIQSVKLKFSDVEDGIIKIKNEELRMKNEGAYDLQGRKLQGKPTQRGVYINNGHKVLI